MVPSSRLRHRVNGHYTRAFPRTCFGTEVKSPTIRCLPRAFRQGSTPDIRVAAHGPAPVLGFLEGSCGRGCTARVFRLADSAFQAS